MGIDGEDDFDDFFRGMFPRAVVAAQRVTGSQEAAEDAAIEALARAHCRWDRVRKLGWRDAWVLRVTLNEALRHIPRDSPETLRVPDTPDLTESVVLREVLVSALNQLPKRQCEVVALRYIVDLAEADVALALGVTAGTIKSHLHRGLAALRVNLTIDVEEDTNGIHI